MPTLEPIGAAPEVEVGPPPERRGEQGAPGWSMGLRLVFVLGIALGLWGLILFILFGG
ncbi:MAG TPA: hypothetical protein VGS12_03410 [Caulobacteraceae bacterium]|nr:hypothetical protein [Caulobacteraceae bacterium]